MASLRMLHVWQSSSFGILLISLTTVKFSMKSEVERVSALWRTVGPARLLVFEPLTKVCIYHCSTPSSLDPSHMSRYIRPICNHHA